MEEKFLYFMDRTERDFAEMKSDMAEVKSKLEQLISFRVMLIGASMAISAIGTVIFNLVYLWVRS